MKSNLTRVTLAVLFLLLFVSSTSYFATNSTSISEQVTSGELTLFCQLNTGLQQIDPAKVIKFDSDFGWVFTEGSSKNCTTYKTR